MVASDTGKQGSTNKQNAIRIMVVDDHALLREGLITLLETFPDLELVGEAANGADAVRLCAQVRPDIVLMDLVMPGMDGITAIRAIRQTNPETRVIALTSFNENHMVKSALEAGVISYLMKNISADQLAQAIRAAYMGDSTMAPEVTRALISVVTQPPEPGRDLTGREREVLALVVEGLSNTQIAEKLSVSPSTVKNHISRIFSKLDVATRTEAATLAIKHRIVNLA